MWKHVKGPLFLGIAVLILGACTEPRSHASRIAGLFVLQSIDDQPLPKLEPSAIPEIRATLVADTFAFDGRGHYTRRVVEEIKSLTDSHQETRSSLTSGDYVVSADTAVEFPFRCPMGVFCIPQPHGFLQPTGDLLLVYTMNWMHESRYKRAR